METSQSLLREHADQGRFTAQPAREEARHRADLEAKLPIERYYMQLTKGCGQFACDNEHCASSLDFAALSDDEAAEAALRLEVISITDGGTFFCIPKVQPKTKGYLTSPSLSFGGVKTSPFELHKASPPRHAAPDYSALLPAHLSRESLAELMKDIKDDERKMQALASTIRKVFSSAESINYSFLMGDVYAQPALVVDVRRTLNLSDHARDNGDTSEPGVVHGYDHGMDLPALADAYKDLIALDSPTINEAILDGSWQLLDSCKGKTYPSKPGSLRQFLILLLNPLFLEYTHVKLFAKLCDSIGSLSDGCRDVLVGWLERFPADWTERIVAGIHTIVALRTYSDSFTTIHDDKLVCNAIKTLHLFYLANEKSKALAFSEFYNPTINTHLLEGEVKEDFIRWSEGAGFSFCAYPFVVSAATKAKVLQLESVTEMSQQVRSAILRSFLNQQPLSPFLVLKVHRQHLVRDALTQLANREGDLKKQLKVQFVGEDGVDEGGVAKEFFQVIIRELFDPNFGMFTLDETQHTFWFNPDSLEKPDEFHLVGIVVGLAIHNGVILPLRFPSVVYRRLCGLAPTFEDLKEAMPEISKSLQKVLEYDGDDFEDVFYLNFEYEFSSFGVTKQHELKEGGADIPVTKGNRHEYVELRTRFLLEGLIAKQYEAFERGFMKVCGGPALKLFRPEELELLVCGSLELDFQALRRSAKYDGGYTEETEVVTYFWEIVDELPLDLQKNLLMFATGSDRSPINGLGSLPFFITRASPDSDRLPTSHTCFNQLLLPEYSSKEKLKRCLLKAIEYVEGFGML